MDVDRSVAAHRPVGEIRGEPADPFFGGFFTGEFAAFDFQYVLTVVLDVADLLDHARLVGLLAAKKFHTNVVVTAVVPAPRATPSGAARWVHRIDSHVDKIIYR